MDPRHPEQSVIRLRELMNQYDRIEKDIKEATVSSKLGQLEREGGLVIQEICLVAPRIHEAMMQISRQRRHELSHASFFPEVSAEALKKPTAEVIENYVEKIEKKPNDPKPKKKKSTKKKKVEK